MKYKKIITLLCILCFSIGIVQGVYAENEKSIVSPAINVIVKQCHIAKMCTVYEDLTFNAEDFERALNLSEVSSITITKVPDKTVGILKLGNSEVSSGQTISRANIELLNFVFLNEKCRESSFNFTVNGEVHELMCMLYSLKRENMSPIVNVGGTLETSTYKNVSLFGELEGYDPDGDEIIFEVISNTKNGLLRVSANGEYEYKPINNFVGKDSFKYVAVDIYGNYSNAREVVIDINMQRSSMVFSDIEDNLYHIAAINLAEKGIVTVAESDGSYYFNGDVEVSRIEFLVMAMRNLGISPDDTAKETIFADDEKIAKGLKGYVKTATEMGIISGKIDKGGNIVFAPNDKITRAEAAVILNNMTEFDMPIMIPVFADEKTIPTWAENAIYALTSAGVMRCDGGYVSATENLRKGECVYMLYKLNNLMKK